MPIGALNLRAPQKPLAAAETAAEPTVEPSSGVQIFKGWTKDPETWAKMKQDEEAGSRWFQLEVKVQEQ